MGDILHIGETSILPESFIHRVRPILDKTSVYGVYLAQLCPDDAKAVAAAAIGELVELKDRLNVVMKDLKLYIDPEPKRMV